MCSGEYASHPFSMLHLVSGINYRLHFISLVPVSEILTHCYCDWDFLFYPFTILIVDDSFLHCRFNIFFTNPFLH